MSIADRIAGIGVALSLFAVCISVKSCQIADSTEKRQVDTEEQNQAKLVLAFVDQHGKIRIQNSSKLPVTGILVTSAWSYEADVQSTDPPTTDPPTPSPAEVSYPNLPGCSELIGVYYPLDGKFESSIQFLDASGNGWTRKLNGSGLRRDEKYQNVAIRIVAADENMKVLSILDC
jgi:hypothetical protein